MSIERLAALGAPTSILTTELNSLSGPAGVSVLGPEYNNSSNRDRFGIVELALEFVNPPTAGGLVHLFCIPTLDGTVYPDGIVLAQHYVQSIEILSDDAPKVYVGELFFLLPTKMKFALWNEASEDLEATANIVKLYTTNRTF